MKFFMLLVFSYPLLMMAQSKKIRFLALGDSYTIGESVAEDQRWPVQLAGKLAAKGIDCASPNIIATTGWRTDDLKKAVALAHLSDDYYLVSLLIGVNNQYQGKSAKSYAPEFEELLSIAIKLARGQRSNVIVVSIPDYGYTPFGKEKQQVITKEIDEFNEVNRSISKRYGVQYFNITDISRRGLEDPSLVAEDGLHPSGKMYGLWVERIMRTIKL